MLSAPYSTTQPQTDGPTRQAFIDALRGLAVLGILPVNLLYFGWPLDAVANPLIWVTLDSAEFLYWSFVHVFFEQKFITLLSLVFGISLGLFFARPPAAEGGHHGRRMASLLAIGLLHAYGLWYGDILVMYALCGFLVWPLRELSTRRLMISGGVLIAVPSVLIWGLGMAAFNGSTETTAMLVADWYPSPAELAQEVALYQGDWWAEWANRAAVAFDLQFSALLSYHLWRTLGLMLIGLGLARLRPWESSPAPRRLLAWAALTALPGLTLIGYGWFTMRAAHFEVQYTLFTGVQWNYWGSLLLATSYALLLAAAYQASTQADNQMKTGIVRRLAAIGRYSLTVYLGQTIVCTTLFYGHGLGWFGEVAAWQFVSITLLIWVAAFILVPMAQKRFAHGPAEWVWRTLTYRGR